MLKSQAFWEGCLSIFDLFPPPRPYRDHYEDLVKDIPQVRLRTPQESTALAWKQVGDAMWSAMGVIRSEHQSRKSAAASPEQTHTSVRR